MKNLRSLLFSAVAALSVIAATVQPVIALTSSLTVDGEVFRVVDYVSSDANEIRVSTVVKGSAATEGYAARVVPIKSAKVSSFFKPQLGSLIRASGWWFAFMGIVESAGWAIDELKNEVVTVNRSAAAGYIWLVDGYWRVTMSDTPQGASDLYIEYRGGGTLKSLTSGTNQATAVVYISNGNITQTLNVVRVACDSDSTAVSSCLADYKPATSPVSDADFYNAVASQMAADPAYAASAFIDPATGKPFADLFEPVPYIPGLSAADEALVNCFVSGQLQMVDSQTACYVATQAEYDRVRQQAEALAAGRTPEAAADALNADMKQPITQTQYEESNKKYSDAVADVTAALGSQAESDVSDIEDHFNELDGIVTDLPNTSLPAPARVTVPQYVDCQQIHLSDGNGHDLDFPSPSQCAKIETFKQGFGYFLAISVVFLLTMQLLTRPHG